MSKNPEGYKEIAVFIERDGAPAPNGSTRMHVDGKPEFCGSCAGNMAGLEFDRIVHVPQRTKALPGSKEAGCKLVDPSLVERSDNKPVPACFHPDWSKPAKSMETTGLVGRAEIPLQLLAVSATELLTGGEQYL